MINDEIIKTSFTKVKQHIETLEKTIIKQNEEIKALKEKINNILNENKEIKEKLNDFNISIRNNGVKQSINQSINQLSKQLSTSLSTEFIKSLLERQFKTLSKQELKTFLTIYQLEEEKNKPISYDNIAKSMSLSTSCVRAYTSSLIKKGLPIIKQKINNKISLFSIKEDFRSLNIKQKLIELYYESNAEQTKLFDI